ncbi:unnamed protein product [Trichobilharzia regenti]|nr:unnamed protein product [Trichobilharzia regenti]
MKSVDENNSGIYESDQENQCDNASTCKCTCHDNHQKLPHKQTWNWEQLDCRKVYIPPFYLTSEYHSDTYLHIQSKCYNGQSVPPNTPHKSMMMMMTTKARRIYQSNRFNSVDLSTSEDSLVFRDMDKTVSHVSDPGDCISLPSSPSSELSLSRLHGARVRNRLDNTSLISRNNNSSSNDSFKYSNANDKKSMKTVGSSLKSSGKWTSCFSVTTTSNLKQLKLTAFYFDENMHKARLVLPMCNS